MQVVFGLLLGASAIAVVKVDYVAPVAGGYIYRSDNNGPASLIQLGAVPLPYQQPQAPHAFAPPLNLAQPFQLDAAKAIGLEPLPLPYVAAKPIVVEDAKEADDDDDDNDDDDDDDSDESSEEELDGGDLEGHGHAYEKGAGSDFGAEEHNAYGEKGNKGYNSKGHHTKGEAGHYGKEHDEGHYSEGEGEKANHHDEADAHGKYYESGESYKGGDHGHKKDFGKGEDVTGYHKMFHKDEYKKDHDFYDVADNSGHFNKHGYEKGYHGSEEGGHKKAGHHDSAGNKGGFGKAGFHANGHFDDSDDSHSAEEGNESHYNNHEDFGKKGGSGKEKEYEYEDVDGEEED